MESMVLPSLATSQCEFGIRDLGFGFEFLVRQALPAELAGLGRMPLALGVRLGGIDAEELLDATPCKFRHRYFAG
jgi:hypothetical protein